MLLKNTGNVRGSYRAVRAHVGNALGVTDSLHDCSTGLLRELRPGERPRKAIRFQNRTRTHMSDVAVLACTGIHGGSACRRGYLQNDVPPETSLPPSAVRLNSILGTEELQKRLA